MMNLGRSYRDCAAIAAALLLVGLTASPREAGAYARTMTCDLADPSSPLACKPGETPLPIAWPGRCVGYHIAEAGSATLSTEQTRDAIHAAFQTWEEVACSYLSFVPLGLTNEWRTGYDLCRGARNANVVMFEDAGWSHGPRVLAVTFVTYDLRNGEILDADISVNTDTVRFGFLNESDGRIGGRIERFDLQNVLTHEIGHLLGLDHTEPSNMVDGFGWEASLTTMYSETAPGETTKRHLHADDAAGICAIYPMARADAAAACAAQPGYFEAPGRAPGDRCPRQRGCAASASPAPGSGELLWPVLLIIVWSTPRWRRLQRPRWALRSSAGVLLAFVLPSHAQGAQACPTPRLLAHERVVDALVVEDRAFTLGDDGLVVAWRRGEVAWIPLEVRHFPDVEGLDMSAEGDLLLLSERTPYVWGLSTPLTDPRTDHVDLSVWRHPDWLPLLAAFRNEQGLTVVSPRGAWYLPAVARDGAWRPAAPRGRHVGVTARGAILSLAEDGEQALDVWTDPAREPPTASRLPLAPGATLRMDGPSALVIERGQLYQWQDEEGAWLSVRPEGWLVDAIATESSLLWLEAQPALGCPHMAVTLRERSTQGERVLAQLACVRDARLARCPEHDDAVALLTDLDSGERRACWAPARADWWAPEEDIPLSAPAPLHHRGQEYAWIPPAMPYSVEVSDDLQAPHDGALCNPVVRVVHEGPVLVTQDGVVAPGLWSERVLLDAGPGSPLIHARGWRAR